MNIPRWNKWKMKWLLSQIRQSDDSEIVMILNEIITRYHALDPNTDVVFLSLPKKRFAATGANSLIPALLLERARPTVGTSGTVKKLVKLLPPPSIKDGGGSRYTCCPFWNWASFLPFLGVSYKMPLKGFPSRNSPSRKLPLGMVRLPLPVRLPERNSPEYTVPLTQR